MRNYFEYNKNGFLILGCLLSVHNNYNIKLL